MLWNLYMVKPGDIQFHVVFDLDGQWMVCGDRSGHKPTHLSTDELVEAMKHVRLNYVGEYVSFNVVPV